MPTRLRKVRRFRGSRFHGWGQVGQHRKSGGRGGRGQAGLGKHKWTWTVKYEPDHFGGRSLKPKHHQPVKWTNVGELDILVRKGTSSSQEGGDLKVIDLSAMGYTKLLGRGSVSGAYRVRVASCTERAREKMKAAGGEVVEVHA